MCFSMIRVQPWSGDEWKSRDPVDRVRCARLPSLSLWRQRLCHQGDAILDVPLESGRSSWRVWQRRRQKRTTATTMRGPFSIIRHRPLKCPWSSVLLLLLLLLLLLRWAVFLFSVSSTTCTTSTALPMTPNVPKPGSRSLRYDHHHLHSLFH